MPKRILRNALLMAAVTFLMALGLLFYIRSTGPLPGGGAPGSVLLHDGVYTSAQQGYLSEVTVTVAISGGRVASVEADAAGETGPRRAGRRPAGRRADRDRLGPRGGRGGGQHLHQPGRPGRDGGLPGPGGRRLTR